MNRKKDLNALLNALVHAYEKPAFIAEDPVSIPHLFHKKEDVEIAGFIAAIFAWGQRKTIINKAKEFLDFMGNEPHDFILHASDEDLKCFNHFKHRTFQPDDAFSIFYFLRSVYLEVGTLEYFFSKHKDSDDLVENGLRDFKDYFMNLPTTLQRSGKHISSPATGSACKRLCMYLRWMVRSSEQGVDFGIWKSLQPKDLIMPLDVHVFRAAKQLALIKRSKPDWTCATELTNKLAKFDEVDPVKYDFALFHIAHDDLELN